jgi:branched-chain amino acid transport system permease protein
MVSLAIDRFIYAPIRSKEGVASYRAVFATIAMLIIISNGAKAIWGSDALSYPQLGSVLKIGNFSVASTYIRVIVVTAIVMIGLNLILFRTKMGLAMRAYADDPSTASLMGIVGGRVAGSTSFLAGALGAVGGVLLAQIYYASYNLGSFGLKAFAAAILGGFGSIVGAVVGGLILGVFENLVSITISTSYKDAVVFTVFIAVLLLKPSGIFKS